MTFQTSVNEEEETEGSLEADAVVSVMYIMWFYTLGARLYSLSCMTNCSCMDSTNTTRHQNPFALCCFPAVSYTLATPPRPAARHSATTTVRVKNTSPASLILVNICWFWIWCSNVFQRVLQKHHSTGEQSGILWRMEVSLDHRRVGLDLPLLPEWAPVLFVQFHDAWF